MAGSGLFCRQKARRQQLLLLCVAACARCAAGPCSVGRPSDVVCPLNDTQTVEYELRWTHGWQWFVLPTESTAAVAAGLVLQRGSSRNFPRTGFVMMASSSGVPPGTLASAEYDPTTYVHDDPVGARRQFIFESPIDGSRPKTDWKVLTLGIDANRSMDLPEEVQVPLDSVLIGLRCHEPTWTWPYYPGCRVALTTTLLPFGLSHGMSVAAPMARGDTHVYRVTVGDYDSLNISLSRDVNNRTDDPARGLVGSAMLNLGKWSRPGPLEFPYNLSQSPLDTELELSPEETQAMIDYAYSQLRADKGLLNLAGCADGIPGCRKQFFPTATDQGEDPQTEKQNLMRAHLWARALGDSGRGYAALWDGVVDTYVERVCIGADAQGTYYLTIYADGVASGDGRLSASSDGYEASDGDDNPVHGVDSFGWWNSADNFGCHCCGDDAGLPSGTCGLCSGAYPYCAGLTMPPASRRVVRGYVMTVSHLSFTSGLVPGDDELMGCVSYGQWRHYTVETASVADAQLRVSLSAGSTSAQPVPRVGGLYAAAGRVPTATDYDLLATYPMASLTLTPCDVTVGTTWHFAISLGAEADGARETLFGLSLVTSSALALIDATESYLGTTCCDGITNWMVPSVPGDSALSVNLTVLSGSVHGVFLQYDSCPRYTPGDPYRSCAGLCEVGWVTHWDRITGHRHSESSFQLTVPMAETIFTSDERRAGRWYVGVKALPGEAAVYTIRLSLARPAPIKQKPYCSPLDRFCASGTQRYATVKLPLTTAGDNRPPGLTTYSAAGQSRASRRLTTTVSATLAVTALAILAHAASPRTQRRRIRLRPMQRSESKKQHAADKVGDTPARCP